MRPIIKVENLGKRYRIGPREAYGTLRESLTRKFRTSLRTLSSMRAGGDRVEDPGYVWAIRDLDLEVQPGEILGVFGGNGAGKSTLLKILSRITRPTKGRAELYGGVRSLLEVGTGFHPELTGRENVFLNGAILGMRRAETARKFNEIVSFAEVEKFIDTPVKYYSSGMYVRLAFAVAAHLEPEILLVDEVLAVGDARFFTKSTTHMRELNRQGTTIVLVTHNMWLAQTACSRAIWMRRGQIAADGEPLKVIGLYRQAADNASEALRREAGEEVKIADLRLTPESRWASEDRAYPDSGLRVTITTDARPGLKIKFLVRLASPDGFPYFTVCSDPLEVPEEGRIRAEAIIPRLMLMPGNYKVWAAVASELDDSGILADESAALEVVGNGEHLAPFNLFWNQARWSITTY